MNILQLSTDDFSGGASRAAYRLHQVLCAQGVDSRMRVLMRQTANERVVPGRGPRSFEQKVRERLARILRDRRARKFKTDNLIMHSYGQVSAGLVDEINAGAADVLNLHWIVNLLSVEDIGRLRKPIVWTLHDMWAFCGGEHYAPVEAGSRYSNGYRPDNRPAGESGPDLNREAWESKRRAWADQRFQIVAPSRWMAGCVRDSVLFRDTPVRVIPNPIEMEQLWRPLPRRAARVALGLDPDNQYVLSGSAGGSPHLKGEDLLRDAMGRVAALRGQDTELLIFGQFRPAGSPVWPCPVHWLGPVRDDHVMATIYSACDIMVVPSRQDNLPNTAVEANACGAPVAGFEIGGLPDIVSHQTTGWLAKAFDTEMLAYGIDWMLADPQRLADLSALARKTALGRYSGEAVTRQYMQVYEEARAGWRARA